MIWTICYFLQSIKSVFILVPYNTSLRRNYVAHPPTVVLCDRLNFRKKEVCLRSLCIWNQLQNEDFSTNLHSTTNRLKHSSNFESVVSNLTALSMAWKVTPYNCLENDHIQIWFLSVFLWCCFIHSVNNSHCCNNVFDSILSKAAVCRYLQLTVQIFIS